MNWYMVLVVVCVYMAITLGIVAEKLYQEFYRVLSWFAASAMLAFVLLGVYALQRSF